MTKSSSLKHQNHLKDSTIRKQAKQIKKLQLEVNALKISLSGSSPSKSNDVTTSLHINNEHLSTPLKSAHFFNHSE